MALSGLKLSALWWIRRFYQFSFALVCLGSQALLQQSSAIFCSANSDSRAHLNPFQRLCLLSRSTFFSQVPTILPLWKFGPWYRVFAPTFPFQFQVFWWRQFSPECLRFQTFKGEVALASSPINLNESHLQKSCACGARIVNCMACRKSPCASLCAHSARLCNRT